MVTFLSKDLRVYPWLDGRRLGEFRLYRRPLSGSSFASDCKLSRLFRSLGSNPRKESGSYRSSAHSAVPRFAGEGSAGNRAHSENRPALSPDRLLSLGTVVSWGEPDQNSLPRPASDGIANSVRITTITYRSDL